MEQTPNLCGRQADLIAYLYNEASRDERADFARHLQDCAACSTELKAFQSVRSELELWQVSHAPHVEVMPKPNRWQALREAITLFPFWLRLTAFGATAVAAALVLFSLTGLSVSAGPDGFSVAFGQRHVTTIVERQPDNSKPAVPAGLLTRAEAEAMIEQAVAEAQARAQSATQAQLASLEQRLNAAHDAKLASATRKLHNDYRQLMASSQPSLREWLFAANDEPETEVKANEKSN
ncbi:MAG: zf-HC2 domain-containing protein [Blastocatellia bacterium]